MNEFEAKLLKRFLCCSSVRNLADVNLVKQYTRFLIYPTNDLWLTEKQYLVLKEFLKEIGENDFYFTQFDGGMIQDINSFKICKKNQGIFSKTNPVYKFNLDSEYFEYKNIFLYSVSVLFSSKGTWAIFIDETFDAGFGILLSCKDYVDKFKKLYEPVKTEYKEWMDDKRYEEDTKYYENLLKNNGIM